MIGLVTVKEVCFS